MRIARLVVALVVAVLVARGLADDGFTIIHVGDLAALIDQGARNLYVYDANPESTRESQGVIPGAHMLSSLSFDPAKELPRAKDAKLVFYCANTH